MRVTVCTVIMMMALGVSVAAAQEGFTDYRQAANDQYSEPSKNPGNNNPGNNNPGNNNPGNNNPGNNNPGNNNGQNRPTSGSSLPGGSGPGNSGPGGGASGPGGREVLGGRNDIRPIAVAAPTDPVDVNRGTLPFTGGTLGVIALLGLALLAAGFLAAAAARLRRTA